VPSASSGLQSMIVIPHDNPAEPAAQEFFRIGSE